MSKTTNRRDVLKAIGATSGTAIVGTVAAKPGSSTTIRLVEAGVEYRLPGNHSYFGAHLDGMPSYYVDERTDKILLTHVASDEFSVSEADELVVAASELNAAPYQVTPKKRTYALPTALQRFHRVHERVQLADQFSPPTVIVEDTGKNPELIAGQNRISLRPGITESVELEPLDVSVVTKRITDEVVEIDGVPEERQGHRAEFGSVKVEATPVLSYRYLTDLDVRELPAPGR